MTLMARFVALVGTLLWSAASFALPSTAFYYGNGPLPSGFKNFDWIIVNPGPSRLPSSFAANQTPFAYASIGETVPSNKNYEQIPHSCDMGTNPQWGGKIINLSSAACRSDVIEDIINPLWHQGYHAFFLDTLDSYKLATKTPEERAAQRAGLVTLIHTIKKSYPSVKLIANRGFSVFPEIKNDLVAVVAESLFNEWNQSKHDYQKVPDDTRKALTEKLNAVKSSGLPVIVIDYLPPLLQRTGWWKDAQKIKSLGYIPYVTDGSLTAVGAGLIEPLPRHILMLYSSNDSEENSSAFSAGVMPIEYLGYIPVLHRLNESLPPAPQAGEYAGVIVWSDGATVKDPSAFSHWIDDCKKQGIPLLFIGGFSANGNPLVYQTLGLKSSSSATPATPATPATLKVTSQSREFGYEIPVKPKIRDFRSLEAPANSQVWLGLQSNSGAQEDAAAITNWGGYAVAPYVLRTLPNKDTRWVINPFALYRNTLRLPEMPVPDTTTESGRRLFMAHTDGDGFVSRADFPPYHIAGETYMHRILERYKLPFTGSVIVGDLLPGDRGLYPALAPLGDKIAREVFKLPYVEIGSHMWSHPFNWPAIEAGKNYPGINLPVPGYHFSPYMEAVGAAKWIDKHLAPPDKRVVIDQWSGDCEPDAQVVGLAYQAGLMNINGGTSFISKKDPSITAVPPIGIFRGSYLQVFAPDANEDYFTNQWQGPFWGFENVIQTFEMTNKPHRLKPIDIYTHWYTGTKLASLAALEKVYNWVLKQPITPIYIADYSHIAINFFKIQVARQDDGFLIQGVGALREMRMPTALGYPNIAESQNVAGFNKSPNGNWYVHLTAKPSAYIALTSGRETKQAYIESANAPITRFKAQNNGFSAELKGNVPVQIQMENVHGCVATLNDHRADISQNGNITSRSKNITISVDCGQK